LAVVFKKQDISQQVVTRMQDLASDVHNPGPSQPLVGRGAQAPRCWNPNLGPPQLFSRVCAPANRHRFFNNIDM